MISRVLDKETEDYGKYSWLIKDYNSNPKAFQNPVVEVFSAGIVTGRPDGTFGCNEKASRAEASAMIVRLIDSAKRRLPEVRLDKHVSTDLPIKPVGKYRDKIYYYVDGSLMRCNEDGSGEEMLVKTG